MCTLVLHQLRQAKWWFDFKLEPIFTTASAASKNEARLKRGQNCLKKTSRYLDLNP